LSTVAVELRLKWASTDSPIFVEDMCKILSSAGQGFVYCPFYARFALLALLGQLPNYEALVRTHSDPIRYRYLSQYLAEELEVFITAKIVDSPPGSRVQLIYPSVSDFVVKLTTAVLRCPHPPTQQMNSVSTTPLPGGGIVLAASSGDVKSGAHAKK
jgi:hypothetical protein